MEREELKSPVLTCCARKMRVLIIAPIPGPKVGGGLGGLRRVTQLIYLLKKEKKVTLVIPTKKKWNHSFNWETVFILGYSVDKFDRRSIPLIARIFYYLLVHKDKFDLVIAYNPLPNSALPAILAKILIKKPVVIDYADFMYSRQLQYSKQIPKGRLIDRTIENFCLKMADGALTSSSFLRRCFRRHNIKGKVLLYRGTYFPPDFIQPNSKGNNSTVKIAYVGSLDRRGGCSLLIHALKDLKNSFLLYLVGAGPEKIRLKELVKKMEMNKKARFNVLPPEKVYQFLRKMDILVIPSLDVAYNSLNFPTKLMEYLAAGKPVICTNVGDLPKIIHDGVNGLVVEPNVSSLKQSLELLIRNSQLRRKLGENAKVLFKKEFHPEVTEKRLNSFIKKIVNKLAD